LTVSCTRKLGNKKPDNKTGKTDEKMSLAGRIKNSYQSEKKEKGIIGRLRGPDQSNKPDSL
jgi:hypothetical protein